ncbi:4a-hydroxytetrahydrobiopterin dehydratase [Nocardia sp. NPDC002869]|uniref:4a-hydroxytetrahydrobiopterin dehydratase n=1 Tax=Nocardia sp. NPDC002869 TaxID=3161032 RepID=UPI00398CBB4D
MTALPTPLDDSEIADGLEALPGWQRNGDEITRTFAHTYHECVHLAVYSAAKAREVGRRPNMLITWQRIEFRITTHDFDRKLTELDFDLARDIDRIAEAAGETSSDRKT